jgi:nucleoside-diphosphate-sugar epimerase
MVVGKGLIASMFFTYQSTAEKIIFASGISNSSIVDLPGATRESSLMSEYINRFPDAQIIYFSTASVYDDSRSDSFYVQHKLRMERLIRDNASNYVIFRVSNIVGGGQNPHTLINYFLGQIALDRPLEIWQYATRNIIGLHDFFSIVDSCIRIQQPINEVINVANPFNYTILQIVDSISRFKNKVPILYLKNEGTPYFIDTSPIKVLIEDIGLDFSGNYLDKLLKRYYK